MARKLTGIKLSNIAQVVTQSRSEKPASESDNTSDDVRCVLNKVTSSPLSPWWFPTSMLCESSPTPKILIGQICDPSAHQDQGSEESIQPRLEAQQRTKGTILEEGWDLKLGELR